MQTVSCVVTIETAAREIRLFVDMSIWPINKGEQILKGSVEHLSGIEYGDTTQLKIIGETKSHNYGSW